MPPRCLMNYFSGSAADLYCSANCSTRHPLLRILRSTFFGFDVASITRANGSGSSDVDCRDSGSAYLSISRMASTRFFAPSSTAEPPITKARE